MEQTGENGSASVSECLEQAANEADSILIGPGLMDALSASAIRQSLMQKTQNSFVLDASALSGLWSQPETVRLHMGRVVLTPHAGEMARMLGVRKEEIEANPADLALRVSNQLQCVVALKGASTFIASPDGKLWRNDGGVVGLGTAGSGDVLAGIIVGLLARGASPTDAALWGVYVHAQAGERLSLSIGKLGFLAHEILAELPQIIERIEGL